MNALAAFQVLVLAMAAAMAVEALKPTYSRGWRALFWMLFAILGVIGIATNNIAASWPGASSFMVGIGSSPVALFLAFLAWVIVLQRPWRRTAETSLQGLPGSDDLPSRLARLEHNHANLRDHYTQA